MKLTQLTFLPLIASLLLLSGCGTTRMDANDTDFPIAKEVVPSYKADQTISVSNYYDKPKVVQLYGDRIDADLKQYTDTAIKLLAQGLTHQNISTGPNGSKSIKLRVHNVKYEPAFWTIRADVNITAELGNGKSFTVFHHNASPMSGWRAVSGAITRATEKVLKHPDFLIYMNE